MSEQNSRPPRETMIRARTDLAFRAADDLDEDLGADYLGLVQIRFSPVDEWTEINSAWEGHFMERFAPGAWKKTIRERAGHWLAIQVEGAKIALSDAASTEIDLHRLEQGLTLTITRDEFDASIDKLVARTEKTVQQLLVDAGVDGNGVDTIFFTGGSSSVPLLRQRLAALLPQARCVEGDRFGSIGSGLALDAVRKFG